MIISKTPFRISFFGGGTDYPAWYRSHGGAVLSATIDKYCYINCRALPRFFEHKYRIVWSHIENVSTIGEILHPAVREGFRYLGINGDTGMEFHHQGDLPARAGMGSSSAFAVGLIKAITAFQGHMIGKKELAMRAIHFEQSILNDKVGSQDQVAAAYGGLNLIRFQPDGDILVEPLTLPKERIQQLESHLLMFYTGTSRLSSEIAGDVIRQIPEKERTLREMHALVEQAVAILSGPEDLAAFGHLMHETWRLKRQLSDRISNPTIDKIYQTAMDNGALGGKLLGAGASGFMVFFVPPADHQKIKDALPGYLQVPFCFENQGCTLIHYSNDN